MTEGFIRTIDNRPYGSLNIYAVVLFVRILVGTSIARPILLIMNRISPPQAVPLSLTREALLVKTAFSLKIYRLPLLQAELAALPSEGIKDNKVFTKFVKYATIHTSISSEELPKTVGGLPFFREGVCFCPLSFFTRRAIRCI